MGLKCRGGRTDRALRASPKDLSVGMHDILTAGIHLVAAVLVELFGMLSNGCGNFTMTQSLRPVAGEAFGNEKRVLMAYLTVHVGRKRAR